MHRARLNRNPPRDGPRELKLVERALWRHPVVQEVNCRSCVSSVDRKSFYIANRWLNMNIWNNYKFNKDLLEPFSCRASNLRWLGSTKHKRKRKQKQKQKIKHTQKRKQMRNSTKAKPKTQKRKRKRKSKEHGKVLVHHAWSKLHASTWIVGSIIKTPTYDWLTSNIY